MMWVEVWKGWRMCEKYGRDQDWEFALVAPYFKIDKSDSLLSLFLKEQWERL